MTLTRPGIHIALIPLMRFSPEFLTRPVDPSYIISIISTIYLVYIVYYIWIQWRTRMGNRRVTYLSSLNSMGTREGRTRGGWDLDLTWHIWHIPIYHRYTIYHIYPISPIWSQWRSKKEADAEGNDRGTKTNAGGNRFVSYLSYLPAL